RRPGPGAGFLRALDRKPGTGRSRPSQGALPIVPLASSQNFAAMERRRADTEKLGGRAQVIRIDWQDAEVRIGFEPEDPLTPETVFYDARWALELLGRARRRLEQ